MVTFIKINDIIHKERTIDTLEFEVVTEENEPVSGYICIKLNGITILDSEVENGKFSEQIDFSKYSKPSYDMEIIYGGGGSTNASIATKNLTLNLNKHVITVNFNDLQNASYRFCKWIDVNKRLPGKISINKRQVPVGKFLYLLAQAVISSDSANTDTIDLVNINTPKVSTESIKEPIVLTKEELLDISNQIISSSQETKEAPSTIETSKGKIGFMNLLYTLAIVVSNSSSTGLISQVNVRPWKKIVAK